MPDRTEPTPGGHPATGREQFGLRPPDLQPTDALFLDIDGTLLDIAAHPTDVVVPPGLPTLLLALRSSLDGALAILSGRTMEQVDALLAPAIFAGAGEHGAVVRTAPAAPLERMSRPVPQVLADAVRVAAADLPAIEIEEKTSAIAVHYRNAPKSELIIGSRLTNVLEHHPGWVIMRGRRVYDIVPMHVRKGGTLALLCSTPPFRGRRPVMIGDDVTDVSAFEAAIERGGHGLSVASNLFSPSEAHFPNPAAVRGWLQRMADLLSAGSSRMSA